MRKSGGVLFIHGNIHSGLYVEINIVDLGLRRHLLPRKEDDPGYSLENVVFLELLQRSYKVNIGKAGNTEVDFVARKNDRTDYQVTANMTD